MNCTGTENYLQVGKLSLFALASLLAASCGDGLGPAVGALESRRDEVQLNVLGRGFELATDEGTLVTGAIHTPARKANGEPWLVPGTTADVARMTCGVTFVSPRYAITAAHCVSPLNVPNPEAQALLVQTYDVTALHALLPTHVTGFFPNYSHGTLSAADGYLSTAYTQCYVVMRCGSGTENYNCSSNVDIALIKCLDRPLASRYVNPASSDPRSGAVEMYWFHEILDMPTQKPSDSEELDHYNHYWFYNFTGTDFAQNFHYHPNNQLLPLHSTNWDDASRTPRTRTTLNEDPFWVWTDLFGCHGSSGSGVMQRTATGVLELLGPAVYPGDGWTDLATHKPLLCLDYNQAGVGQQHIAYTDSKYTRELATRARIDPGEGMPEWVAWFVAIQ